MVENRIMTTKEVAGYIKVNEKTVLKLAQYGKLPAVKVGSQWRYHLVAIDKYLQKQLVESSDDDLDLIIKTKEHPISLSRLADERLIDLNLQASSKKNVLSQLARMAYAARITPSYEGLFIAIEEREKMLSTAVGQGVALPHPRWPHHLLFKEPRIIIGKANYGIDFDVPDKQKVYLFFMPCAPSEYVHVRLLAKISKLLHVPNIIEQLKNTKKQEMLYKSSWLLNRHKFFPILMEVICREFQKTIKMSRRKDNECSFFNWFNYFPWDNQRKSLSTI